MSAKAQKKFAKRQAYGSSLPVNGLSSTLAFTPIQVRLTNWMASVLHLILRLHNQHNVADTRTGAPLLVHVQGIELQNPTAHLQQQDADMRSGTESYFSEYTGFKSVKKPPPTFG